MDSFSAVLATSAILFGFLFSGFWWSLNRELEFPPEERHFKPGYALLIGSTALVGYYGIALPLREAAEATPQLAGTFRGVVLGLVAVVGYMLTEYAHYSVFQRPKYTTPLEWVFFLGTLVVLVVLAVRLFAGS